MRRRLTPLLHSALRICTEGQQAQGGFEYLLVIGGVVVAVVGGLLAFDGVVAQVVGVVCPAVDTADSLAAVGSCITP